MKVKIIELEQQLDTEYSYEWIGRSAYTYTHMYMYKYIFIHTYILIMFFQLCFFGKDNCTYAELRHHWIFELKRKKLWKPHLFIEEFCFSRLFLLVYYLPHFCCATANSLSLQVDHLVQHWLWRNNWYYSGFGRPLLRNISVLLPFSLRKELGWRKER